MEQQAAPSASVPPAVLVVDDETGVRDLMARWLASGGYAVSTASSAVEALDRVHVTAPAVALCDIRMPGRDGLWLAEQIRNDAPQTAVIMATGVQDVGSAVTSLRQGVVDYLTKPFGRERLQKSLLGLTPGAERLLAMAPWDGNVRELRNVIERACILADGEFITERELAVSMPPAPYQSVRAAAAASEAPGAGEDLLVNVEREHIQRALLRANGNKKAAARMLGLSRRALYRRLERLDLGDTIMRRRDTALDAVSA